MITFEDLRIGSVVRLASGSIRFVVTGKDDRSDLVALIGYGDRIGVVRLTVDPAFLIWPLVSSGAPREEPPFPPRGPGEGPAAP